MSVKKTSFTISINSLDDLLRCINLASLLELSGWPKPGNVHRTQNFEDTRFEHFLAGIAAIQPNFRKLCERVSQLSFEEDNNFKFVKLGLFFKEAAEDMLKWQNGGNVLLGHILILAPLVASATICLNSNQLDLIDLKYFLCKIIDNSTLNDTLNLYEAIRTCNPGGLGEVEKYDVNSESSLVELKNDNITLKKIFEISKNVDLISYEYSTGFKIILDEGLPYFFNIFHQFGDPNIAIVNTYLKILSDYPDTLISRKIGIEEANRVSKAASEILQHGGISTSEGLKMTNELDNNLQERKGQLNPGTTADLIAGVIFCALIFGFRV
ncbi:MAG: triphosphoribosyl-dephospho-CoA synthase [Promethearchaeota archaeon]